MAAARIASSSRTKQIQHAGSALSSLKHYAPAREALKWEFYSQPSKWKVFTHAALRWRSQSVAAAKKKREIEICD